MADKKFTPANKYQEEFLDDVTRFTLVQGGRQSGKSLTGTVKSINYAATHDGSKGVVIAPTYTDLSDVNIPMIMEWLPDGWMKSWSKAEKKMELINGSEIVFRSADKPEKFGRGRTLDWFWWDEPSFTYNGYEMWQSFYPALMVRGGVGWFTCTPKGRDWVYKYVRRKAEMGDKNYKCWTFSSYENPYIDREFLENAKKDMSEKMYRQEIMAEIVDFVGLVYPDFDETCIKKYKKEEDDQFFVGVDVGFTNPTAVALVAQKPDNTLWVIDEVYDTGMTAPEVVKKVQDLVEGYKIEYYVIDPSSAAKDQTSMMSMQGQLSEFGLYTESGNNDVIAGINRMTQLIRDKKLFVDPRCQAFIGEMQAYSWDEGRSERNLPERPKKERDHLCDAVRYTVMGRPDQTMKALRDDLGNFTRRGYMDYGELRDL